MQKYYKYILAVCLFGTAAFAVKQAIGSYDKVNSTKPQWFPSGIYVGSNTINPVRSTDNRLDGILCAVLDYDFPILTRGSVQESDTKAFTLTGSRIGDPCIVGVGIASPTDGGSAWTGDVNYGCLVRSTNSVVLRQWSPLSSDGGNAPDAPDAGFNVCVFRNGRQAATTNNGN